MARKGALGKFDIARLAVVDAFGAAQLGRHGQFAIHRRVHQGFNLIFNFVGKLKTIRPEQFDAIVLIGIMRGRNHNANISAQRAGEKRNARRRYRAKQKHIHAHGGETGHQRRLNHIARQPRILANHNPVTMLAAAKIAPRRQPKTQRHFSRHVFGVNAPAYAVCSEILTNHNVSDALAMAYDRFQPL